MGSIDLRLESVPAAMEDVSKDLTSVKTKVSNSKELLAGERHRLNDADNFDGKTANSVKTTLIDHEKTVDKMDDTVGALIAAINTLARGMHDVEDKLAGLARTASAQGLQVVGDQILGPVFFTSGDDPEVDRLIRAYDDLVTQAQQIREDEAQKHYAFQTSISDLSFDLESLLLGTAAGVKTGLSRIKKFIGDERKLFQAMKWAGGGTFLPRWKAGTVIDGVKVGGRFRPFKDVNFLKRLGMKMDFGNWVPHSPLAKHADDVIDFLDKAKPAMKWVGRTTKVLDFGLEFYEQYSEDSLDPGMDEGTKIARATGAATFSVATTTVAAAGGAKIGAAIGTVAGPPGVLIGGLAGGLIGGAIASPVGEWVEDIGAQVGEGLYNFGKSVWSSITG